MNIDEMRVVLTGATGGIGRPLAKMLAARGAALLLVARDRESLETLRERLDTRYGGVDYVVADVSDTEGRRRVADAAAAGGLDANVLINNAGVNQFARFEDQDAAAVESIITTNALAPILLTHELLPVLRQQSGAVILNVGSILGSIGLPGQAAYASSKFALHGFSESLRRELRGSNVAVRYVAPRTTDTAMNSEQHRAMNDRMGTATDSAEAVANCIVDALASGAAERFLGWPERLFVKLNALLPSLVDRSVQKQTDLLNKAGTTTVGRPKTSGVRP